MTHRLTQFLRVAHAARARFGACALCVALCVAFASTSARAATIVVLPINDDPALTSEVRAALAPYGTVQAPAATAESLAAAKSLGIACTQTAPSCLAELGGLAGGDLVVGGVAVPMPEGAQIILRLVEVSTSRLVRTSEQLVPESGPGRVRALRVLAVRLIAPDKERGSITVFAPTGAAIQLDGAPVGHAPLPKPLDVPPGKHEVYAALNGYLSASAPIDVDVGQSATVSLDLLRDADGDGEPDPDGRTARPDVPRIEREGRVAITAVEGSGLDERQRNAIADAIAVEIQKLENTVVIPLNEVEATLPQQTALMLACHEPGCHALIATELALQDLIVVEVGGTPSEQSLVVRRFDGPSGNFLIESVHDGIAAGDGELALVIGPAVQRVFPRIRIKDGEVRGMEALVYDGPRKKKPLPPWLFYTSLAATGVTAASAGGLAAWSLTDESNARGSIELAMWVAVGATAALIAADVALALSTDWGR